ncbi:MAG: hypothetical protein ACREOJ_00115, partial [Gemmatimonadaceae bacterium]
MRLSRRPACMLTHGIVLGALMLAAQACSSDSTAPRPLTQEEADSVGHSIAASVSAAAEGMVYTGSVSIPAGMNARRIPGMVAPGLSLDGTAVCGTESPDPPNDTDQDGVPDNVMVTFSGPACTTTAGEATISIGGSVGISDFTPSAFDVAYQMTANLQASESVPDTSATLAYSASNLVTPTSGGATLSQQGTLAVSSTLNGVTTSGSVTNNWNGAFATTSGAGLTPFDPVPAGSFTLSGSTQVTSQSGTFGATITTVTPLAYDPECPVDHPFRSGAVQATISSGFATGVILVTWTNCSFAEVTQSSLQLA